MIPHPSHAMVLLGTGEPGLRQCQNCMLLSTEVGIEEPCAVWKPPRTVAVPLIQRQEPVIAADPKAAVGIKKPPTISVTPPVALIHLGMAFRDGARKYGAYNWRKGQGILASVYIDPLIRHAMAYWDGERNAPDSHVHHLGHAMACAAILLDAEATGKLIDDRPPAGTSPALLAELNALIKAGEL